MTSIWGALISVLIKLLGGWVARLQAHHAQLKQAQAQQTADTEAKADRTATDAALEQSHAQTDQALQHVAADADPAQRLRDADAQASAAIERANDQL